MGVAPIFCFRCHVCGRSFVRGFLFVWNMDLERLLEPTLAGMGYELVDVEVSGRGKLVRVFIDKADGISVDDCTQVSHQLSRLLQVEGVDYDRLEISSPGLDRVLKRESDFQRFLGAMTQVRLRVPIAGRRNFVGVLRAAQGGELQLEIEGALHTFELANLEKARLVPQY